MKIYSVYINNTDPIWSDDMKLRVNASGHVLHAYVNGKYLGKKFKNRFSFYYSFYNITVN